MKWTLDFLVQSTSAKLLNSVKAQALNAVGTDTRANLTEKIFFALKGDQYDAHQFLNKAVDAGTAALVVHDQKNLDVSKLKIPVLLVSDTLIALQEFAKAHRKTLKGKILAITGSNGKTTTKEFSAQILSEKFNAHYSKGSFNNHWGVPLTLLEADSWHDIVVVEMGMNHAGEIQRLVEIADPDITICTVVGRAHIEHFGSEEKIAEAKAEIYRFSRPDGTGVFNLDNSWTAKMLPKNPKSRNITFSANQKADVSLKIQEIGFGTMKVEGQIGNEKGASEVSVFGEQNVTNLMAAAAIALAAGMSAKDIWQALKKCETNWGRNQILKAKSGAMIIFDGYNANPDSMSALLGNLKLLKGKKIFGVFGEMRELGDKSAEYHFEFGKESAEHELATVWFYGPHFQDFERGFKSVKSNKKLIVSDSYKEDVASQVANMLEAENILVCKASRGMKIERFVELLQPNYLSGKKFSSQY